MNTNNGFVYLDETHEYFLDGKRLVSVTEAIRESGLSDFSNINHDVLKHAQERGIAVHRATHYLDEGDLDWATVSPEIEPYVRAWERFKADTGVIINETEQPLYHATMGFAGTPDRIIQLNGQAGTLDIKTYDPDNTTGMQLAGYSYLRFGPQRVYNTPKRWGLWLKNDGRYSLKEYEDRGDEAVFMACVTIAKWKRSQK